MKAKPALADLLPGVEVRTGRGSCWLHERSLDQWPGADPVLGERLATILAAPPPGDLLADRGWTMWREGGVDQGLFLDLETTGLSAAPVFLCGLLLCDRGEMLFRLYLARDYSEEGALLEAVSAEVARRPVVVTYNGKSYDIPFLKERTGRLRTASIQPGAVLDLLHPARRRWGGVLPDCRLKTLEWHLLGRRRAGDIDGALIPETYHRFVREKDARPLIRVMAHNLFDLYTLAEITERAALTPLPSGGDEGPGESGSPGTKQMC